MCPVGRVCRSRLLERLDGGGVLFWGKGGGGLLFTDDDAGVRRGGLG